MRKIDVAGLPLAKLKAQYLVIIVQSLVEFRALAADSPVFCDQEKMYFRQDRDCFVYFPSDKSNGGNLDEWSKNKEFSK